MLASNFNTMTLEPPPTHEWHMDTGVETHMTSNSGNLCTSQLPSFSTPSNIVVGDGSLLPVTHTGSVTFPTTRGSLHLNNVLVSPQLIKNLISVRQFTIENRCSVEFDPYGFSVKDLKTRSVIIRCNSSGPLYPLLSSVLRPLALAAGVTSSTLWHRRLGHLGHEALSSLVSSCAITCNKSDSEHLCHACQLGRHVRLPFPTSRSRAINNFDLIHCDLWTSPVPSISGYKYYLVILDDCSHFLWTFPLRLKSDTFSTLTHFFAYVSTQFGVTIKSVQCDNGREFDNSSSRTFFLTHGVTLRMSCPHTSPQNGKAERIIRTTNNIIRSLLFQASMPTSYWVEALHTATYLLNRQPTKTLASATPFFALFRTQPSYDHLRVFGCRCYPNLSSTAAHKLALRSAACVFLGYPSEHKGYRCLDLSTNRLIISRHVTFDETSFPFSEVSSPPSSDFDFLLEFDDAPIIPIGVSHVSGTSAPRTAAPVGPSPQVVASGATTFLILASTRAACISSDAAASEPPGATPAIASASLDTAASPEAGEARTTRASSGGASLDSSPPLVERPAPPNAVAIQPPANEHSMMTRGKCGFCQPKVLFDLHAATLSPIPKSYRGALADPNWRAAMSDEFSALQKNNTWDLVPRPSGANIVTDKWVYRHKFRPDGSLERYKARWVLRGFTQRPGIDFDEIFSPVVKPATIRTVLTVALFHNWHVHLLDVKNAFLHGTLDETVYCVQPAGFVDSSQPDHVCHLNKSLYELKQAPRAWYSRFATHILSLGFVSAKSDTSLFIYQHGHDTIYLLLYVDDIVLTASSDSLLQWVIAALQHEFSMTDLGPLHHFLGLTVTRQSDGFHLSQRQYILEVLERAGMVDCKPCSTPVDMSSKLSGNEGPPVADPTHYRGLAGALQYITFTRPDISYVVQQVCLHMHDPREPHYTLIKRILRYLHGTLNHGLQLCPTDVSTLVATYQTQTKVSVETIKH
jgi:hypothetical protein